MKTLIGLGTALTIAVAPMALEAKPRFKIRGGGAVVQMLGAAASGDVKAMRKAEKKIRKAARKAGVPVSLSTVTAAATGGAAVAASSRTTTTQTQATPAPRLAPVQVSQRPQARPARALAVELADTTPPVTTLREGVRVETSAVETATPIAPSVTPVTRRVTSEAPVTTPSESSAVVSTAKVVTVEEEPLETRQDAMPTTTASAIPAPAPESEPVSAQQVSLDTDDSLFGGPTGY
ncbi:hypothetical protein [Limimaricola litoreus]|uniref:Uncharacterized protein n=1 Tax=Limimaricola litoreus TaxID=2955316 RepID=A0A9X2JRM3_9RHOB|nr:hypothetical protein [Limimaricola litoreus]MCP1168856.1 hypothetical protein [Limimaricola litoreus]